MLAHARFDRACRGKIEETYGSGYSTSNPHATRQSFLCMPAPADLKTGLTASGFSTGVLLCASIIFFLTCTICLYAQLRASRQRRQAAEEQIPLLDPEYDGSGHSRGGGGSNGRSIGEVAAIGTPARDFVRLSSLPASVFRSDGDSQRCMACSQAGECVALRPCGHAVLCRACSDFVYTCPHCGQYISGIASVPAADAKPAKADRHAQSSRSRSD